MSDIRQNYVMTRLSVMMFLQFFVWGAWYVTVGNYMGQHFMTDQIFWAYTVGPIAALVSPFFLGMVADRFFATEKMLGVMHIVGGAALLVAPMFTPGAEGDSPWPFIGILAVHMLCYMPTLGLTNTLALHNMTHAEKQFPMIRVWGTIGWIVAGVAVAKIAGSRVPIGDAMTEMQVEGARAARNALPIFFYLAGGCGVVLGVLSFFLPHTPPPAKGREFSARDALGLDALALLKDRSFAVFILCSFLLCIPLAAYYAYAPVFANAMQIEDVPFKMAFGQMSEIFFMLVMPIFFVRLGVKWMLLVGMIAWVARYALFALAADDQIIWMVLAGIIMHGICYDFFFVTGFIYTDRKAPKEVRGAAQGFLVLVTQGLGLGIGAQVIGALVKANTAEDGVMDWSTIWLVPSLFAAGVALIFFFFFNNRDSAGVTADTSTPPDELEATAKHMPPEDGAP